jgi:hypothetical protein
MGDCVYWVLPEAIGQRHERDQINVAVNRVNTITSENKENIDVLVREVSKFKVE